MAKTKVVRATVEATIEVPISYSGKKIKDMLALCKYKEGSAGILKAKDFRVIDYHNVSVEDTGERY